MSHVDGLNRPRGRLSPVLVGGIAAVLAMSSATAAVAGARNWSPVTGGPVESLHAKVLPLGISNALRTYVLEVSGDPVTVVDANAATPLNAQQKSQIQSQLKQKQQGIEAQVRSMGGQVMSSYQLAYNGIKVRIPAQSSKSLASIAGVVAVHPLQLFKPTNVHGVPLVGGPAAWGGVPGFRGEGIKIADIDTGIDYTHADFGGPGTTASYQAALSTDTADPDPTLVGPTAPKVKGGTDLVGDDYNADSSSASYQPVPHPDNNPLDCNGHGTHTAGTMAGLGVLNSGATFTGTYDASTVAGNSWLVGPGVAPKADLYAVRVFGCAGSTDAVVDAIEWSVAHGMDVINMSLGSPFGAVDDPSAVAASNASRAGVIVVASAGNSGPAPYLVGSPSTGDFVLSVAAEDPTQSFPAALVSLSTGQVVTAIDANAETLPGGALPVKVLYTGTPHDAAHISLGCDPNEYTAAGVAGDIVVVKRGTCARVARAVYGQKAGAAAVLMVNTSNTLPPFEGAITSNPDTGEQYHVTIPFLGVPSGKGATMVAADGGSATLAGATLNNPGYLTLASFTSGGGRSGDSRGKPDVTAPGVAIASAGMGTGNAPAVLSGTSMAAPHTTGAAALVRQAHPTWGKPLYWQAAIYNTADPALVTGYSARLAGVGLIQAHLATRTDTVALADGGKQSLGFGYAELGSDFSATRQIRLINFGKTPVTFAVNPSDEAGSAHSIALSTHSVTIAPRGGASIDVTLKVPAATAGDSSTLNDVSGLIEFTPIDGSNHDVELRVPYYMVPRTTSGISTQLDNHVLRKTGAATATITNSGLTTGAADWYSWGLTSAADAKLGSDDVGKVGVQSFPGFGVMAFGIQTNKRWSNAATNEFDVLIDVNDDGTDDYDVVGIDQGLVQTGSFSGKMASVVFDLRTGAGSIHYFADAPFNSKTLVLPVDISQLCASGSPCLSAGNPRFTYHAQSFGLIDGTMDDIPGPAKFNAFTPSLSTGAFDIVAPGDSTTEPITLDPAEWALTPSRGFLILTHDNPGDHEAQVIYVK